MPFGGKAEILTRAGPVAVTPPDGKEHKRLTYRFANGVRMYHGGTKNIEFRGDRAKREPWQL